MIRKLLVSLFCVLNVLAVLVANQPAAFEARKAEVLDEGLGGRPAWRVRYAEWLVRRYAHLVGLDNRWMMFSKLPRFDWWYVIQARHRDGSREVLPLPLQSERSLVQRVFFDFREAKVHLNIYNQPRQRWAYARHLCRAEAERTGRRPWAIVWELHYRPILERREAAALGRHRALESHSQVLQVVECVGVPEPDAP